MTRPGFYSLAVLACMAAASVMLGSAPAQAQPINMSGGGPVEVTSTGGFDLHEDENVVIANIDARAVRGDTTVLADQLVARYRKKAPAPGAPAQPVAAAAPAGTAAAPSADAEGGDNEVYRLEAHGHVRILTPTDEAVGDDAIYDMDQAVLVMTGHAMKLTTPNDVMTARDTMEYYSNQHMAVGRGAAVVVTNDARRLAGDVLVAYTVPDDQKPPAAAPNAAAPAKSATGDPLADSSKLREIDAFGNVEVRSPTDTVRGARGIYITETGIARVVDHVRMTHLSNQMNGAAADMNMKTGIARIVSGSEGRVKGVLVPHDAPKPTSSPASSATGKPTP